MNKFLNIQFFKRDILKNARSSLFQISQAHNFVWQYIDFRETKIKVTNQIIIVTLGIVGFIMLALLLSSCSQMDVRSLDNTDGVTVTKTPRADSKFSSKRGNLISVFPALNENYEPNPGIGWQHEPGEDDFKYLPETVAYSDRKAISWKILNPAEGVYNWSLLDDQLAASVAAGKQYSFRIYTMMGENFGGNQVPDWVLQKGAALLVSGEPDYSNCIYQEEWGKFVMELVKRYDGNPDIAFIDISGYGNFNEWSWQNDQTNWDAVWEQHYSDNTATPETMETLDSQARRRLADMFIGGSIKSHSCSDEAGNLETISYSYKGFQKTQLVMPYAGINQSTQYVFLRRSDVGFRYDCLGNYTGGIFDRLEKEISSTWKNAPVVFELCDSSRFDITLADGSLQVFHGSVVHNNGYTGERNAIHDLMLYAGYRYFLKEAQLQVQAENKISLSMIWQNIGLAPSYPKMGQIFQIHFYLVNLTNHRTIDYPISADVSAWMPAASPDLTAPGTRITTQLILPSDLDSGDYEGRLSIIDERTGKPINLAFSKPDSLGRYYLTSFPLYSR
jgi:hypothetical protein